MHRDRHVPNTSQDDIVVLSDLSLKGFVSASKQLGATSRARSKVGDAQTVLRALLQRRSSILVLNHQSNRDHNSSAYTGKETTATLPPTWRTEPLIRYGSITHQAKAMTLAVNIRPHPHPDHHRLPKLSPHRVNHPYQPRSQIVS